jgi:pyruvate/2-oxoglutarate dehydrogenase complex dihydrolipoamide acyltransferase (E2) component
MALSRGKKIALGLVVAVVAAGQIPTQESIPSDPVERPTPVDLSGYLPMNPPRKINVLFIHHSCGGQLLADHGEDYQYARCIYMANENGGELRKKLTEAGFVVNEASYGSIVGEKTDLFDWEPKFRKEMERIVDTRMNDARFNGTAINEIVVFKSCYPNNRFLEDREPEPAHEEAGDAGPERTIPAPAAEAHGEQAAAGHGEGHGEGHGDGHGEHAAEGHGEGHGERAAEGHGEGHGEHAAEGHGEAAGEETPELTVANAKKALASLLPIFEKHPKTLFVYMTAPPNAGVLPKQPLWKKLAKKAWHKWRKTPSELDEAKAMGARARAFNSWVVDKDGWLAAYPLKNVVVFDYYDVLTDHGASNFLVPLFANKDDKTDEHPNYDGNMSATDYFMPFIDRAVQHAGLVPEQLTPAAKAARQAAAEAAKAAEEAARAAEEAAKAAAAAGEPAEPEPFVDGKPKKEEVPDHLLSPIERKLRGREKPKRNLKGGTLSGAPVTPPGE